GAAGRVHHAVGQFGVDAVHHKFGDGARGVKLACVTSALQVAQNLFVHIAKGVTLFGVVVVDAFLNFVNYLADKLARFHVVVGVFKDVTNNHGAGIAAGVQLLQAGEQDVVDEVFQVFAGHAFGVGGPVTPAQTVGNGALVVVVQQFPFLFAVVVNFQEQHPH